MIVHPDTNEPKDDTSPAQMKEIAAKNTHRRVFELLRAHDGIRTVLDIPCGEGAFLLRLRDAGFDAFGADIAKPGSIKEERFKSADMNAALPFKNESFDAVACIDGIEHIENVFVFVRECRRILRPGGILFLSTPNISAIRSRWRHFLTGFHNKGKSPLDENRVTPFHHINLLSYPSARYALHTNGFRISRVTTNRIKLISWIYLLAWPFSYITSLLAFRKDDKEGAKRSLNHEVIRLMHSLSLYLGETMIIEAKKQVAKDI